MDNLEYILHFWQTVSATIFGVLIVFIVYLISTVFLMKMDFDELEKELKEEEKELEDLGGGIKRNSKGTLIIDTSETKERREEQHERIEKKLQQGISVETLEKEETNLTYDYTRIMIGVRDIIEIKATDYVKGVVSEKIVDTGRFEEVFSIGLLYSESLKGYAMTMNNYKIKEGTKEMEGYKGNGTRILLVEQSDPSKEGIMEAQTKIKIKENDYVEELYNSLKG